MKHTFTVLFLMLFGLLAFSADAQTQDVTIKIGFDCDHYQEIETGQSRLEKHLMYTKGIKDIKWMLRRPVWSYNTMPAKPL